MFERHLFGAVVIHMQRVDGVSRNVARKADEVDKARHRAGIRPVVDARREEEHPLAPAVADAQRARGKRRLIFLGKGVTLPPAVLILQDDFSVLELHAAAHLVDFVSVVARLVARADDGVEADLRLAGRACDEHEGRKDGADHKVFAAADVAENDLIAPVRVVGDDPFRLFGKVDALIVRIDEGRREDVRFQHIAAHFHFKCFEVASDGEHIGAAGDRAEVDVALVVRRTLDDVFFLPAQTREGDDGAFRRRRAVCREVIVKLHLEGNFLLRKFAELGVDVGAKIAPLGEADDDRIPVHADGVSVVGIEVDAVDGEPARSEPFLGRKADLERAAERRILCGDGAVLGIFGNSYLHLLHPEHHVLIQSAVPPRFQPGCDRNARTECIRRPIALVGDDVLVKEHIVDPDGEHPVLIAHREGKPVVARQKSRILCGELLLVFPDLIAARRAVAADALHIVLAVRLLIEDGDEVAVSALVREGVADAAVGDALCEHDARGEEHVRSVRVVVGRAHIVVRRERTDDAVRLKIAEIPLRQIAAIVFGDVRVAAEGDALGGERNVAARFLDGRRGVVIPVRLCDKARRERGQRVAARLGSIERGDERTAHAVLCIEARLPFHARERDGARHLRFGILREFRLHLHVLRCIRDRVGDRPVVCDGEIVLVGGHAVDGERRKVVPFGGRDGRGHFAAVYGEADVSFALQNDTLALGDLHAVFVHLIPLVGVAPACAHLRHPHAAEVVARVVGVAVAVIGVIGIHHIRLFDAERCVRDVYFGAHGGRLAVHFPVYEGGRIHLEREGDIVVAQKLVDFPAVGKVIADAVHHDLPSAAVLVGKVGLGGEEHLDARISVKRPAHAVIGKAVVEHLHAEGDALFAEIGAHAHLHARNRRPGIGVPDVARLVPGDVLPERFLELAVQRDALDGDPFRGVLIDIVLKFVSRVDRTGDGGSERCRCQNAAAYDGNFAFHLFPSFSHLPRTTISPMASVSTPSMTYPSSSARTSLSSSPAV